MVNKFYDGTKLLSLQDLDGQKPEIYICTSNRSAGKTTWFNRYFIKKFIETGEKFMLLYRYKYEISDCADKFFKDIKSLFFPDRVLTSKPCNGVYHLLLLDGVPCGYAIALNSSDLLKKYSHLFSDTQRILFDEFQPENNRYITDEVKKLISIHTSIARGQGKQSRYVPVYMISNKVSILNPYYAELGIATRLTENTVFLRGNGWVLENGFNETASQAQNQSTFMKAFSSNEYMSYLKGKEYLYNDSAFIEKMTGASNYIATFRFDKKEYSIREYLNDGVLYVDKSVDKSFKIKIASSVDDMIPSFTLKTNTDMDVIVFRKYFNNGLFRFKDMECKNALINLLKY